MSKDKVDSIDNVTVWRKSPIDVQIELLNQFLTGIEVGYDLIKETKPIERSYEYEFSVEIGEITKRE